MPTPQLDMRHRGGDEPRCVYIDTRCKPHLHPTIASRRAPQITLALLLCSGTTLSGFLANQNTSLCHSVWSFLWVPHMAVIGAKQDVIFRCISRCYSCLFRITKFGMSTIHTENSKTQLAQQRTFTSAQGSRETSGRTPTSAIVYDTATVA